MMTGNNVWLDVAVKLYRNKIAKPVFWLGDDKHLFKARDIFGNGIHSINDFVHYQSNISSNKYSSEFIEFFRAPNYLRAKDRCFKMMDRLDNYGLFNRLDREVVFNKLTIWILKEMYKTKPEYLIMSEFAHSHAQYLVYEIADFIGLKIAKFNDWGSITPMMFLQEIRTGKRYTINFKFPKSLNDKIMLDITNHVNQLKTRNFNDKYLPNYIKNQWKKNNIQGNYKLFLKNIISEIKMILFQLKKTLTNSYYKINPYKLDLFQLNLIYQRRKKYLINSCFKNSQKLDLDSKFVYFALHFEPERTTNPDGGYFHDQFIALLNLRRLLPDDINIFVKEHPTQFKLIKRGVKGRSPLFYKLIKEIDKVFLIDINTDTYSLTKNSLFVATITGTAAREAAIMGKKALIFGDAWFNKCPNVFSWNKQLTFDKILNHKLCKKDEILNYLKNEMKQYSIVGCQNPSSQNIFKSYINKEFKEAELNGVYNLMKKFFS